MRTSQRNASPRGAYKSRKDPWYGKPTPPTTIAETIKKARIKANLTQAQMAEKIDENRLVVVRLESGARRVSVEVWKKLKKALKPHLDRVKVAEYRGYGWNAPTTVRLASEKIPRSAHSSY